MWAANTHPRLGFRGLPSEPCQPRTGATAISASTSRSLAPSHRLEGLLAEIDRHLLGMTRTAHRPALLTPRPMPEPGTAVAAGRVGVNAPFHVQRAVLMFFAVSAQSPESEIRILPEREPVLLGYRVPEVDERLLGGRSGHRRLVCRGEVRILQGAAGASHGAVRPRGER
jgi:hypothetical protein